MSIKPIPLEESTAQQRLDYAASFLNLELSGTESDDDITAKIHAAQPDVTTIFVNEPDAAAEQAPEPGPAAPPVNSSMVMQPIIGAGERRPGAPRANKGGVPDPQHDHLGRGDPRAVIFINVVPSEDGSGERDVPVGVNGYGWLLKRGVDLNVPWRVVCALEQAEMTTITHRTDQDHIGEVAAFSAKRFPYNFKSMPSQEEIDAWDERMGKFELGGTAAPTPQPIAA